MKQLFTVFAVGFALMSCFAYSGPASAGEKPNILIMGEDADPDTAMNTDIETRLSTNERR